MKDLEEFRPDLVVLDLVFSGLSGLEVCSPESGVYVR